MGQASAATDRVLAEWSLRSLSGIGAGEVAWQVV
jgi:hypothetical protein